MASKKIPGKMGGKPSVAKLDDPSPSSELDSLDKQLAELNADIKAAASTAPPPGLDAMSQTCAATIAETQSYKDRADAFNEEKTKTRDARSRLAQATAVLKKQRDALASLPSAPPQATTAAAATLARPEPWTPEGKLLSRLERNLATHTDNLTSAEKKRAGLQAELDELKVMRQQKQSKLDQLTAEAKTAQAELVACLQRSDASTSGYDRKLADAEAGIKDAQEQMASLEGRHQTATINEKKAIANLEQIKRHPNAAVVASTSKADDESQKKTLHKEIGELETSIAKRRTYRDRLGGDLETARAAQDENQKLRSTAEAAARGMHKERQRIALDHLQALAPHLDLPEDEVTLLADTVGDEKLVKLDGKTLARLLQSATAPFPESESGDSEELARQRSLTRALEVKLAAAKDSKALAPAEQLSRRASFSSDHTDRTGTGDLAELEGRYARVEQIAKLLEDRHRELVNLRSAVQTESANLELTF